MTLELSSRFTQLRTSLFLLRLIFSLYLASLFVPCAFFWFVHSTFSCDPCDAGAFKWSTCKVYNAANCWSIMRFCGRSTFNFFLLLLKQKVVYQLSVLLYIHCLKSCILLICFLFYLFILYMYNYHQHLTTQSNCRCQRINLITSFTAINLCYARWLPT